MWTIIMVIFLDPIKPKAKNSANFLETFWSNVNQKLEREKVAS